MLKVETVIHPTRHGYSQRIPAACGQNSTIDFPIHCVTPTAQGDNTGAGFDYTCGSSGRLVKVTQQRPNCTVTCDPGDNPQYAPPRLIADSSCPAQESPCPSGQFTNVDDPNCGCADDPGDAIFMGDSGGLEIQGGFCPPEDCSIDNGHLTGWWDSENCQCEYSPILVDISGNGFDLTASGNGVRFDLNNDGVKEKIA